MKPCKQCMKILDPKTKHCPHCGRKQSVSGLLLLLIAVILLVIAGAALGLLRRQNGALLAPSVGNRSSSSETAPIQDNNSADPEASPQDNSITIEIAKNSEDGAAAELWQIASKYVEQKTDLSDDMQQWEFTKQNHEQMVDELYQYIEDAYENAVTEEPSLENFSVDREMSKTVFYMNEHYEETAGRLLTVGCLALSASYQTFLGYSSEEIDAEVQLIDAGSQEKLSRATLTDMVDLLMDLTPEEEI